MTRSRPALAPPSARPADAVTRAEAALALNEALATATRNPEELYRRAVDRVGLLVGDATLLWLGPREGRIGVAAFHHPVPSRREQMGELLARIRHDADRGFLAQVARGGRTLRATGADLAGRFDDMHPGYREYFAEHGLAAMMLAPLAARGEVIGLLGVSRDGGGSPYTEDDERFLHQVAAVVAVAIDNARLLAASEARLADTRRGHERAWQAALHDPLTGLPNRRALLDAVATGLESGEPVGLVLLDLDGFKDVNDTFGHEAGDRVLATVGARLAGALGGEGVLPPAPGGAGGAPGSGVPLVSRLGGDEFAVAVTGPGAARAAEDCADALLRALVPPMQVAGMAIPLGASAGLAVAPRDAETVGGLLRFADIAMYRAKRQGIGFARYDPVADAAAARRLEDVADLRSGLASGEVVLHYQPLVPAASVSGQTGGAPRARARRAQAAAPGQHVEGLVRWEHPERGLLAPGQFLPLAAESGMLDELTRVVLDTALAQAAAWRGEGLDVGVAVNVPGGFLRGPGAAQAVLDRLARTGLPPAALCLELTEAEVAHEDDLDVLAGWHDAGITIAVDDFGTGYSALAYLAVLPVDRIKLDRTFVARLGDARHQLLLDGLARCTRSLGYELVGEGVETAEQERLLAAAGVDLLQGYRYARPLPPQDATDWLRGHAPGGRDPGH